MNRRVFQVVQKSKGEVRDWFHVVLMHTHLLVLIEINLQSPPAGHWEEYRPWYCGSVACQVCVS